MLAVFRLVRQLVRTTGLAMHIITIPGSFFHELAHQLACYIVGHKVLEVRYIVRDSPTFAGYVRHQGPPGAARHLLIGIAPLLMGAAIWGGSAGAGAVSAGGRVCWPVGGGAAAGGGVDYGQCHLSRRCPVRRIWRMFFGSLSGCSASRAGWWRRRCGRWRRTTGYICGDGRRGGFWWWSARGMPSICWRAGAGGLGRRCAASAQGAGGFRVTPY